MKRLLISILTVLFPLLLLGQMFPLSDHYGYNALAINPAFAGYNNALSITALHRNQWVGFKDAPKSYMLSVHTPVDNDRIGLGLLIEKNSIGIFRETSFIGNYAYRMKLFDGKLSLGLGFGVTLFNIAWNELITVDAGDNQLINNPTSSILPTISLGTYYYTKKYFIGISIPRVLSYELDKSVGKYKIRSSFTECTYFLTGGYEFTLSDQIKFLPSILIKYYPKNVVQVDFNVQINLKDRVWIGVGYRSKNMLVGIAQFQINNQLKIVYSYDFNLDMLGKYTNGSHEIGLNYIFRFPVSAEGPRQF